MYKNYILTIIRNFWKSKSISIIKTGGLAIALSIVFLIYIYISFENSYDNYHENGERIFRVAYHMDSPRYGKYDNARTGDRLTAMLQETFANIENTTRVAWMGDINILHRNETIKEQKFLFADPAILQMFSFPMTAGNRDVALSENNSVIISSRTAQKYFGNENPLGKFLDDNHQLTVTGIIDIPENSHFRFDILASYNSLNTIFPDFKKKENELFDENIYSYILLRKDAAPSIVEEELKQFSKKHIPTGNYTSVELFLEPLQTIHFESTSQASLGELSLSKFTKPVIVLFSILGVLIIIIACFNFINISIAQMSERVKEVGVRKIIGAKRAQLFMQFVLENWLYSLIAVLLSILIVQISLPHITVLLGRQMQIDFLKYIIAASVVLLLITVFAGAYPSYIIAGINPVKAITRKIKVANDKVFRTFLVVSQFSASIVLILITLQISMQINHFTSMDMGMDTDDLLLISLENPAVKNNYQALKSEFERISDVVSITASSNIPAVSNANNRNVSFGNGEIMQYNYISVDANFAETFGIGMLAGNPLTQSQPPGFLLNKSAVKELGLENPVGESVTLFSGGNGNFTPVSTGVVVGVLNDFSYRPNYDKSKGVIFNVDPSYFNAMFVRINTANRQKTIAKLKEIWKGLFNDIPVSISYLNEEIKNEFVILKLSKIRNLVLVISIFSFLIALSGFLGISILSIRKRVKEIGIRKVNGASSGKLLILINRKLLKTVIISVLISFPVSVWIGQTVKNNQANGIALSVLDYSIVFLLIAAVIVITVSWQSWRAATRNPVEALRYE